ncbi:hypothetical protein OPV22_009044 [Ensete ventricosum]|uniref:Uncharacterized protein n=1 Tax=Ensete ventricosum TaxID=4639 RepID=A0AAV8RDL8_ENSVE|nr:hypothetical protein OPV22_009044 [Ensete ventricosum]
MPLDHTTLILSMNSNLIIYIIRCPSGRSSVTRLFSGVVKYFKVAGCRWGQSREGSGDTSDQTPRDVEGPRTALSLQPNTTLRRKKKFWPPKVSNIPKLILTGSDKTPDDGEGGDETPVDVEESILITGYVCDLQ